MPSRPGTFGATRSFAAIEIFSRCIRRMWDVCSRRNRARRCIFRFSSLSRRRRDISRRSKCHPIYNFEALCSGTRSRQDPFFHPENPGPRRWQISMQKTKSAILINCLYRMKFRVASRPRAEEEKFTGERIIGVWSVPEVHHALEQITTLILGYRATSRLSPHVIGKVVPWIIYFTRRPYAALDSLYQFRDAQRKVNRIAASNIFPHIYYVSLLLTIAINYIDILLHRKLSYLSLTSIHYSTNTAPLLLMEYW